MKKKLIVLFAFCVALFYLIMLFGRDVIYSFFPSDVLVYDTENSYSSEKIDLVTGDYIVFGTFNGEPIKWKVLNVEEDGRVLIQSEKVLVFMGFDEKGNWQPHHLSEDTRELGSSDWNNCSLKKWLNSSETGGFLNDMNFTDMEVSCIAASNTNGNMVFLLSKEELKKYYASKERVKTATKSAILNCETSYYIFPGTGVWYWLSSNPGNNNTGVHTVTSSGSIYKCPACDVNVGVSPAMYLLSSNLFSTLGDGSLEDPYWIGR